MQIFSRFASYKYILELFSVDPLEFTSTTVKTNLEEQQEQEYADPEINLSQRKSKIAARKRFKKTLQNFGDEAEDRLDQDYVDEDEEIPGIQKRAKKGPSGPVRCEECGLNCPTRTIYTQHFRRNHDPHSCSLCNAQYKSKEGLTLHWRETHSGIKNFFCPHEGCTRGYFKKSRMVQHTTTCRFHPLPIHKNPAILKKRARVAKLEPRFLCQKCGKSAKTQTQLKYHIIRTH